MPIDGGSSYPRQNEVQSSHKPLKTARVIFSTSVIIYDIIWRHNGWFVQVDKYQIDTVLEAIKKRGQKSLNNFE